MEWAVAPDHPESSGTDEHDLEPYLPLPSFMNKWWNKDELDCYEPSKLDSLLSNIPPETGSSAGKRRWPFAAKMSQADLKRLHASTIPRLQPPMPLPANRIFDSNEVQADLMVGSNPLASIPRPQEPLERRQVADKPAVTRASPSEGHSHLDPAAFVLAVKALPLIKRKRALLALQKKSSYSEMVEFAKQLDRAQGASLFNQAKIWMTALNKRERNPMASQLMALLVLFTSYTPPPDEFMSLLPPTLPPELEPLRTDFLKKRADLVKDQATELREALLSRLKERYGH